MTADRSVFYSFSRSLNRRKKYIVIKNKRYNRYNHYYKHMTREPDLTIDEQLFINFIQFDNSFEPLFRSLGDKEG